ncbi:hypothetical protein Drorol1_Dr00001437 [Drosera rotundifolia]
MAGTPGPSDSIANVDGFDNRKCLCLSLCTGRCFKKECPDSMKLDEAFSRLSLSDSSCASNSLCHGSATSISISDGADDELVCNSKKRYRESSEPSSDHGDVHVRKRHEVLETRRNIEHRDSKGKKTQSDGRWEMEKLLTQTDVTKSCCLIIPKGDAEELIRVHFSEDQKLRVESPEGLSMTVWDSDKNSRLRLTCMRLYSKNNNSYVLRKKWQEDFVKRRNLIRGDRVKLYWDTEISRLVFSAVQRGKDGAEAGGPCSDTNEDGVADPIAEASPPEAAGDDAKNIQGTGVADSIVEASTANASCASE